jgi:hypothetical protein
MIHSFNKMYLDTSLLLVELCEINVSFIDQPLLDGNILCS